MRNQMEDLLKAELHRLALQTRDTLELTQKEMSERLQMSESSYSDIETGKTMCGTLTAMLLLQMQERPETFLHQLQAKFARQYEKEMQTI